jgi:hypothetical protein
LLGGINLSIYIVRLAFLKEIRIWGEFYIGRVAVLLSSFSAKWYAEFQFVLLASHVSDTWPRRSQNVTLSGSEMGSWCSEAKGKIVPVLNHEVVWGERMYRSTFP